MLARPVGRAFAAAAAAIAVATLAGVVALWPGDPDTRLGEVFNADTERAEVVAIEERACRNPLTENVCRNITIVLRSGPDEGEEHQIRNLGGTGGPSPPGLEVGSEVRVAPAMTFPDATPQDAAPQPTQYTLSDFERRHPMLLLALAFAALVVIFGRIRGALSLVGLLASLAVVLVFIVPAILEGTDPMAVAIVGSLAVMILTITLAHGLNAKSLAALLGTTASLALVALLARLATSATHLTGLSSEEASTLFVNEIVGQGSLEGLLLAGMVIGALGVLDDVTVSQSSTVMALRAAKPSMRFGELYRRAIEVGRDHVSATVNTLVLAYVGAALPVILILSSSDVGISEGLNFEIVAQEVVAMLVGSIGLIAAVPLTTAAAAALAGGLDTDDLAAEDRGGHVH